MCIRDRSWRRGWRQHGRRPRRLRAAPVACALAMEGRQGSGHCTRAPDAGGRGNTAAVGGRGAEPVSYTHLRAHETSAHL
eukprot:1510057-Alexandrium_andersonii.AAC.1